MSSQIEKGILALRQKLPPIADEFKQSRAFMRYGWDVKIRRKTTVPASMNQSRPVEQTQIGVSAGDGAMEAKGLSAIGKVVALRDVNRKEIENILQGILHLNEVRTAEGRLLSMDLEKLKNILIVDQETGYSQIFLSNNGEVLGFQLAIMNKDTDDTVRGVKAAVKNGYENSGIFKLLYRSFLERVSEKKIHYIDVQIAKNNPIMKETMIRLGFKEDGEAVYFSFPGLQGWHLIGETEKLLEILNRRYPRTPAQSNGTGDATMKGGIDLTAANGYLQTQNNGNGEIKFHLNPAQFAQLQNAPGFTPVIINIQPLKSLPEFLGLNQESHQESLVKA
jgi:L-amino acid N-acyltransferase YncA